MTRTLDDIPLVTLIEIRDALKDGLQREVDEITPERRNRTLFKLAALQRWIERRENEPTRQQ